MKNCSFNFEKKQNFHNYKLQTSAINDRVKFHINYINSYQYQYTLAFGNLVPFRNISLNTCIIKKYL